MSQNSEAMRKNLLIFLMFLGIISCSDLRNSTALPAKQSSLATKVTQTLVITQVNTPFAASKTPKPKQTLIVTATPPQIYYNATSWKKISPVSAKELKEVALIEVKGDINQISWSPDGNLFSVSTSKGNFLFNAVTLNLENVFGEGNPIYNVSFSLDNRFIALLSRQGSWKGDSCGTAEIQVWDISLQSLVRKLTQEYPCSYTDFISFSHDGKYLYVARTNLEDGFIEVWNTSTWKIENSWWTGSGYLWNVSPDRKKFLLGSSWDTIEIINLMTGEISHDISSPHLTSLAMTANNNIVIGSFIGANSLLQLKQVETPKITWKVLQTDECYMWLGLTFSYDNQLLAAECLQANQQQTVRIYNSITGEVIIERPNIFFKGNSWEQPKFGLLAFSPNGFFLASISEKGVTLWGTPDS